MQAHTTPNGTGPGRLALRLFGSPTVEVDGQAAPQLRSRKGLWLLALLALRGRREVMREWLMGTLWPDSPPQNASASLRQSLADLRRALGAAAPRLGCPTPRTVRLDVADADADVLAFDAAILDGSPGALAQAVSLYRGPFLEGCTEDWAEQERRAREQAYLCALETLAAYEKARGDLTGAIEHLRAAAAVDPYRESAQRALIESLAAAGDLASAILAYRDLRLLLRRELGVDPDPETVAVYERARAEARERRVGERRSESAQVDSRIPRPFTTLVGRDRHIEHVCALLSSSRLVTLAGPGGVGKTRLAIGVSECVSDRFADGVRFVDLSPLAEPHMLAGWVMGAVGLPDAPGRPSFGSLTDRFRDRSVLLVLDNCEHVVEACASFCAAVLAECAHCRILATSRQAMGVMGEALYRVPPLEVPPRRAMGAGSPCHPAMSAGEALAFDSVRLFADRARLASSGFAVSDANAATVADICRSVDGLPLGIELAASRVRSMPLPEIASRLNAQFGLTMNGVRGVPERHHSIRAAIQWSYDLLSEAERILLRRLSVFAGGWSLSDAEAVCSGLHTAEDAGGATACDFDVVTVLTELVDQSLVVYEPLGDHDRYSLLETVRVYARERLVESGEADAIRRRHADYFTESAAPLRTDMYPGPTVMEWHRRMAAQHDNLRAALDYYCEAGAAREALTLAGRLAPFWTSQGYREEGCSRLRAALSLPGAPDEERLYAEALLALGSMEWTQGDAERAWDSCAEAHAVYQRLGDGRGVAASLLNLGSSALALGRLDDARSLFEDAIAAARLIGRPGIVAHAQLGLGELQRLVGEYDAAEESYRKARDAAAQANDPVIEALCTADLGTLAFQRGDAGAAKRLLGEALHVKLLGATDWLVALLLPTLAAIELSEGKPERSAVLLGAAEAARERTNTAVQRADQEVLNRCIDLTREQCSERIFERSWQQGRALSITDTMVFAREGALADQ